MTDQPIDILIVEDSVDDSAFMVQALEEAKFRGRLRIVRDGLEALTVIFGTGNPAESAPVIQPKFIILDLKLPKLDGLEVLRLLKTNPHTRPIPIVILSSSQEKRDLDASYQLGVNSFMVKPIDFDEFGEAVKALGRYWLQYNKRSDL
jgi:two-component system response regulator